MSTVVDHRTGEIVDAPSYADVRESIDTAKAGLEAAAEQIVWQIENRVWLVLGHADWNTMREQEYGGAAFMVPRAERPELVARMRRAGLTQQEIADTAGISRPTVAADLNAGSDIEQPETITNARGQQRPASYTRTPEPADLGEGDAGSGQHSTEASPADDVDPQATPAEDEAPGTTSDDATAATPEREGHRAPGLPFGDPSVGDYLAEDGYLADMQFVHQFHADAGKAATVLAFQEHEDRIVELLDRRVGVFSIDGFENVHRLVRSAADFLDRIESRRSRNLRRVK